MANLITMKVEGLKELSDALRQLPNRVGANVLRGAVYAGAKIIREEIIQRAPVYQGKDPRVQAGVLKNSVYMKQIPELASEIQQVFFISVRRGKSQQAKGRDAYYWTWVEFGHHYIPPRRSAISLKSHNKVVLDLGPARFVPAHPFFRPGFEITKEPAMQAIKDYLVDRIPKEALKAGIR
jgi:HK97 gp10 family phage protein